MLGLRIFMERNNKREIKEREILDDGVELLGRLFICLYGFRVFLIGGGYMEWWFFEIFFLNCEYMKLRKIRVNRVINFFFDCVFLVFFFGYLK